MTNDQEWSEWVQHWSASGRIDVDTLCRDAFAARRRMRWKLALDIVGTLFCASQLLRLFELVESPYWSAWCIETLVLVLAFQAFAVWLSRDSWSTEDEDAETLLALSCRRARMTIRCIQLNLALLLVVAFSMIPLIAVEWAGSMGDAEHRYKFWSIVCVQSLMFAACLVCSVAMWRSACRKQYRAERLLQQFREAND